MKEIVKYLINKKMEIDNRELDKSYLRAKKRVEKLSPSKIASSKESPLTRSL